MIQITPHMRVFIAVEPVDFRKGIDGLCGICRNILKTDPFSGYIFVFRNKSGTSIKVLMYDGQGFWLCQKRLSEGKFYWWPSSTDEQSISMAAHELQLLIWNGNPTEVRVAPMWKKLQNNNP